MPERVTPVGDPRERETDRDMFAAVPMEELVFRSPRVVPIMADDDDDDDATRRPE